MENKDKEQVIVDYNKYQDLLSAKERLEAGMVKIYKKVETFSFVGHREQRSEDTKVEYMGEVEAIALIIQESDKQINELEKRLNQSGESFRNKAREVELQDIKIKELNENFATLHVQFEDAVKGNKLLSAKLKELQIKKWWEVWK